MGVYRWCQEFYCVFIIILLKLEDEYTRGSFPFNVGCRWFVSESPAAFVTHKVKQSVVSVCVRETHRHAQMLNNWTCSIQKQSESEGRPHSSL